MNLKLNFAKNYFFQSFGVLFLIVISICFANGQSKDIKNPTPLTSNEISGVIDNDTKGKTFYYSFWVNAGEVAVTLTVEPGDPKFYLGQTTVRYQLTDQNAEELTTKTITASKRDGGAKQGISRIEISKRQRLILAISITNDSFSNDSVGGKYTIKINGADISQKDSSQNQANSGTTLVDLELVQLKDKFNEILPKVKKKKTLLIKMKDGSVKRIDLSQVEEIEIEQ
jgi:hypothetical protein